MVIYEVNIRVNRDLAMDYSEWLRLHVDEMLRLDTFFSAEIFVRNQQDESESDPLYSHFTVHYRARDAECIERYLSDYAPSMRQKALESFGDRIQIHRRILTRIRSDQLRSTDSQVQRANEELDQPQCSQ